MPITAQLDALGKPAWIALIVLGFMVWWPVGLSVLAFTVGSGRMGCGHQGHWQNKMDRMQRKMDWMRSRVSGGPWNGPWNYAPSSGNRAFDEYRTETLRRLEDEQREFREFLDRLRVAKDKTEFDAFMAERRNRPDTGQTHG
ncbi:MAG: DUF2852 domain-containing protein [Pseudolabrys sp.]|jgi:hypothetical protein